jgi:hypothetical protein
MVFDIGLNSWMRLGDTAKLSLPVTIEYDPVDVALA